MSSKSPTKIITYKCENCGRKVMIGDDREKEAECFPCETGKFLKELRRDPITMDLIAEGLQLSMSSLAENTKAAYEVGKDAFEGDEEEELLDVLSKIKNLKKSTDKIVGEMKKKNTKKRKKTD
ncbi:MAG: hypothetical protein Q7S57_05185 [bacterium]|nr:hypothetical protein [bacterium]